MKKQTLFIPLLFILLSCGEYQKVLKSTDVNYKYVKAVEYYENEDFARAMPLFNELSTSMRGSKKAEAVSYYFAYCHYNNGDLLMSSYLFKNYVTTYPNGLHVEDCLFMSAYCIYMESPIYSLDATNTRKAIGEFQIFINKYPNSSKVKECNQLIDELRSKITYKAFENAKQYYTTENYKAAILSLNNVLIDFPGNKYREKIHFLILKSSYQLAINSISTKIEERLNNTLDAYLVFNDNYPESEHSKQAEKIQLDTKQSLKKINKQ
ncbi:MAG: outer membrane protein assembly factor BamD [Flavobacteriales bacterium]